ncbi:MAG: MBL fold metallo-hydrolase [Thermus sp.]|uniref:MBL fold metallo-hydrolase n=1 Tax=Thermus sp. TaxID=275 RepID=UPI00298F0B19|nr:MBL fold metallo-hydrolase [Thermus sp.]MDW8017655.1 MBL fold metallo-hydrolase [Thermus sp.]
MERRAFLKGTGVWLLAGGLGLGLAQGRAPRGVNGGGFYRLALGQVGVVVLSDGQSAPGPLLPNWGANPELQDRFRQTLLENFLNPEATRNNFNPVLLDLGTARLLVDTGRGAASGGRLLEHLALAGYAPEEITHVFLTHGHPDHIGGLVDEGGRPLFPRAQHLMGEVDLDYWLKNPSPAVTRNLVPLRERIRPVKDGEEILPGVRAVASFGHTPGHMSLEVLSQNQRLFVFGDAAGHHLLSLRFPQAYLGFDMDREGVVRTRARLFQKVAQEGHLVTAYHFPWPAVGRIRRAGEGYEFVPAFFEF